MRKNTKQLLLGLVAVAILGGVYAGLMHMPDEQDRCIVQHSCRAERRR